MKHLSFHRFHRALQLEHLGHTHDTLLWAAMGICRSKTIQIYPCHPSYTRTNYLNCFEATNAHSPSQINK